MVLRLLGIALLGCFVLEAQNGPDFGGSNQEGAGRTTLTEDQPESPLPLTCPAGAPIGAVNLQVRSQANTNPLPFQNINHLSEGDTVLYAPIERGAQKRPGEVTLVLVPARHEPGKDFLIVMDPKPADKKQEWKVPQTISVAAFVYGPQGLNKKKVRGFLSQDDQLVAQLADYAEKTSQTEALLSALSDNGSTPASANAALSGFASQYGLSVQLDRNAPPAVQAQTLFATMNPQLANYNPMASSSAERLGQTASVATAAATLFFGSPVGIAAGGTAMLLELRSIAFPGTQFRSSFAQPLPKAGLNLCGQRASAPPHTRVAFLWASRIPNTPTPAISIKSLDYVPQTLKSAVSVEVPDVQWKYLQRARSWALKSEKDETTPITILKLGNQRALEIDLAKTHVPPGDYRLIGFWDWAPFQASGQVHVRPLSDFQTAKLESASQNQLLAHSGKIPVTVAGSDFQFTCKVEIKRRDDEFAVAQPAPFILPKGLRSGPQESMDVQIDTRTLEPGRYALLVSQPDGEAHPIDFKILPLPPKLQNLPILANQGQDVQHYSLKGEHLDLLAKLEAPGAELKLESPIPGGAERNLAVQLKSNPPPGTTLPIQAFLTDRTAALTFPDALQITGPLPVIASSKLSLPGGSTVAILSEEVPAGATLTALLDVKNMQPSSILKLSCAEDIGAHPELHVGEQNAVSSLQQLSGDQLFMSYDTSAFPAGCTLQAVLDNGRSGESRPFPLARVIRVPRIASFDLDTNKSPADSPSGQQAFQLTGTNLEMIAKLGWDANTGVDVAGLPTPLSGQGQQQSLSVSLPVPPAPHAPLFVWLRNEKSARQTTIQAPPGPHASSAGVPEPR